MYFPKNKKKQKSEPAAAEVTKLAMNFVSEPLYPSGISSKSFANYARNP